MAPVIRDATLSDHAFVVECNIQLALETEGKVLDPSVIRVGALAALRDPERLRYWVAEDPARNIRIGQAAITREWSDWRNGWVWWFQSVYVTPEARGQGVFRALHQHIRACALAAPDVIGLRLYVEHQNHRAQQTYEALGLKPGGYHVYEELWPDRYGGRLATDDAVP
jgi:GNAT superfamily N-acetyltransferase